MQAALDAVSHYLARTRALVERAGDADLARRPAPGMFSVGDQLATAIGFAGRAVLPLAGRPIPDRPGPVDRAMLLRYGAEMAASLAAVEASDMVLPEVTHRAGFAEVTQTAGEYLLRFALPNLIFHLTAAYIGLKAAGLDLGKADFDAIHAYPAGFAFDK